MEISVHHLLDLRRKVLQFNPSAVFYYDPIMVPADATHKHPTKPYVREDGHRVKPNKIENYKVGVDINNPELGYLYCDRTKFTNPYSYSHDFNKDGWVDQYDVQFAIYFIKSFFNQFIMPGAYWPELDLNEDGIIDMNDMWTVLKYDGAKIHELPDYIYDGNGNAIDSSKLDYFSTQVVGPGGGWREVDSSKVYDYFISFYNGPWVLKHNSPNYDFEIDSSNYLKGVNYCDYQMGFGDVSHQGGCSFKTTYDSSGIKDRDCEYFMPGLGLLTSSSGLVGISSLTYWRNDFIDGNIFQGISPDFVCSSMFDEILKYCRESNLPADKWQYIMGGKDGDIGSGNVWAFIRQKHLTYSHITSLNIILDKILRYNGLI